MISDDFLSSVLSDLGDLGFVSVGDGSSISVVESDENVAMVQVSGYGGGLFKVIRFGDGSYMARFVPEK